MTGTMWSCTNSLINWTPKTAVQTGLRFCLTDLCMSPGRILGRDYSELRRDAESMPSLRAVDQYGATNPAEFFAVATECFFEKPVQLKMKHAELYEELKLYFQQDPAQAVQEGVRE